MSFYLPNRSYPAERYTNDSGEVSARWRSSSAPHELARDEFSCDYLVTGDGSNGDFGLYRWNMAPGQGGPDPHIHKTLSESFYVLSGTITIHDGTDWRAAEVGDFVYVPEGGIHGFRNDSDGASSMLILFAPGAPREAYFEGLHNIAETGERPSEQDMAQFYAAHDTYWV